jgi:hypothetical protein
MEELTNIIQLETRQESQLIITIVQTSNDQRLTKLK